MIFMVESMITVELVVAAPKAPIVLRVSVPFGAMVDQVIQQSQVYAQFPELKQEPLSLGIFGRKVEGSEKVSSGDRIEIYWPLKQSAMDARKSRVKQHRMQKRGA